MGHNVLLFQELTDSVFIYRKTCLKFSFEKIKDGFVGWQTNEGSNCRGHGDRFRKGSLAYEAGGKAKERQIALSKWAAACKHVWGGRCVNTDDARDGFHDTCCCSSFTTSFMLNTNTPSLWDLSTSLPPFLLLQFHLLFPSLPSIWN